MRIEYLEQLENLSRCLKHIPTSVLRASGPGPLIRTQSLNREKLALGVDLLTYRSTSKECNVNESKEL
jgi:hypothetical protein